MGELRFRRPAKTLDDEEIQRAALHTQDGDFTSL
jgi:hypothetical protein